MRSTGKKVGKFETSTVLGRYSLDVRLDLEGNDFEIRVPEGPDGAPVDPERARRHESFKAATLAEVKEKVVAYLRGRDVTEFSDVIEYTLEGAGERSNFRKADSCVGFDFRAARVSASRDRTGSPKLEIPVTVSPDGVLSVAEAFGVARNVRGHVYGHHSSMPFTVERWKKCCSIKEGILKISEMLGELFGEGGDEAGTRLDAVGSRAQSLIGPEQ